MFSRNALLYNLRLTKRESSEDDFLFNRILSSADNDCVSKVRDHRYENLRNNSYCTTRKLELKYLQPQWVRNINCRHEINCTLLIPTTMVRKYIQSAQIEMFSYRGYQAPQNWSLLLSPALQTSVVFGLVQNTLPLLSVRRRLLPLILMLIIFKSSKTSLI